MRRRVWRRWPDAVLQEEREEADREGKVVALFLTGEAGHDRAEVALEKQRLGGQILLEVQLPVTVRAAEFVARELVVVLNGREERMDALRARDLEIDVEVQAGRDLGDILAVVAVVGDRRAPVAVDGEAG